MSHSCFDGALYKGLSDAPRALHAPMDSQRSIASGANGPLLRLFIGDLPNPCAAHSARNSLKWGAANIGTNQTVGVRDLFIVFENVRNSFARIVTHLLSFIVTKVGFHEEHVAADRLYSFWTTLGFDPETC